VPAIGSAKTQLIFLFDLPILSAPGCLAVPILGSKNVGDRSVARRSRSLHESLEQLSERGAMARGSKGRE
jgi:hypothetical protein